MIKIKNLPLKRAYRVGGGAIETGWGTEMKVFNDGLTSYENKKMFFNEDLTASTKEDWCSKIFFDKNKAELYSQEEVKSNIEHARKQIQYYTDLINKYQS